MSSFEEIMAEEFDGPGNMSLEYYDFIQNLRSLIMCQDNMGLLSHDQLSAQAGIFEALLVNAFIAIKSNESIGINNATEIKKQTMMDVYKNIELFNLLPGDVIEAVRLSLPGDDLDMNPNSIEYKRYEEEWINKKPSQLEEMLIFNNFKKVAETVCSNMGITGDALANLIIYLYLYYDQTTNKISLLIKDASDEFMIDEINDLIKQSSSNNQNIDHIIKAINSKLI
jgi:hypothetical protein